MKPLFFILITLIVSISPCQASADDRTALHSGRSSSGFVSESGSMDIPAWAIHIPDQSFVGISSPCPSIEEARQQALDSAIGQILQAMGADYHLSHESTLSGDLNQSRYELKERLSYTAKWLLNSVQQNVRQYAFRNAGNGHVCFVLIRMRPSELERLKKLTIGAKLTARVIGRNGDQAYIDISESNGVGTTLTEYRISASIKNNHARLITLFLWKVPESENASYEGALPGHVFVKNNSARIAIPLSNASQSLKSIVMGASESTNITLAGYDELGRPVSVPVRFR